MSGSFAGRRGPRGSGCALCRGGAGEEPGVGGRPAGGGWGPRWQVPERRRRRRQRWQRSLGAWVRGGSGSARGLRCERAARLPFSPARRRRRCDWVEDGAGRMEILMTVSKFASICTMVGAAGGGPGPLGRAGGGPVPALRPSAGPGWGWWAAGAVGRRRAGGAGISGPVDGAARG